MHAKFIFQHHGHKGKLQLLQEFSNEAWEGLGGQLVRQEVDDSAFEYKLDPIAIADFNQIQAAGLQPEANVIIETRPLPYRKVLGELKEPNVQAVSFLTLFTTDKKTGAWILKSDKELQDVFQPPLQGLTPDKKNVIFSCQIGVSACQGLLALKQSLRNRPDSD